MGKGKRRGEGEAERRGEGLIDGEENGEAGGRMEERWREDGTTALRRRQPKVVAASRRWIGDVARRHQQLRRRQHDCVQQRR